jgi:hypothetical protein
VNPVVNASFFNWPELLVTMYFDELAPLIVPAEPTFKSYVLNVMLPLVRVSVPVKDCTLLLKVTPDELLMVRFDIEPAAPSADPAT